MKIAIFSDWHLGLNFQDEIGNDSFNNLLQAFTQIKERDVDVIISCGDLFDKKDLDHEIYYKAIELLNKVDIENNIGLKSRDGKLLKIPMISITGNHEFKGKDYKSTGDVLEVGGYLKNLHAERVTIEKEDEKITVFGISGLDDRFFVDVLKKWNPKPIEGHYNILLIHQSIAEYLPIKEEGVPSLSNLPSGFDIIVNGHLHWNIVEKINEKTRFLMPGSTVSTQNKKIESDKEKGFFILNTKTNDLFFESIKDTRKIYYLDLKINQKNPIDIKEEIIERIEKLEKNKEKKPLLRIVLKGELLKGYFLKDIDLKEIQEKYKDDFYISFSNKLLEEKLKESIEKLKSIETEKGDVFERSRQIFFEQIKQTNISKDFDYERLFNILYNNDVEKAKEVILKED